MGIALNCRGCGQALQVAEGDNRPEIECIWCGAKSPVPDRAAPKPALASAIAAGPPPVATASAVAAGKPPLAVPDLKEEPKSATPWYEQTPYGIQGPPAAIRPEPPAPSTTQPPTLPKQRTYSEEPDDDGSPYVVAEKLNYTCQECGRSLLGEMVVCPSCGFNHETGLKHERTYEPVSRTWDPGWPLRTRLRLFIASQAVLLFISVLAVVLGGGFGFTIPGWLIIAGMTAFVLGTYGRVELTRNQRGKVTLKHTWRVCFMERPTRTLRLSQYEGVTKGKWHEVGFWEWTGFVFLLLPIGSVLGLFFTGAWGLIVLVLVLPFTLAPAAGFWYYAIYTEVFYVALTVDHGHPEFILYRGWDERLMNDMYETIRVIAFAVEVK